LRALAKTGVVVVAAAIVLGAIVLADPHLAGITPPGIPTPAVAPGSPGPTETASPPIASNRDIFPGGLYADPTTDAAAAAARLQSEGQTASAALIRQISSQPTALWLGEWFDDAQLKTVLAQNVAAAKQAGKTLVVVTYAVPNRDCGGQSAGGLSPSAYVEWNRTVATALKGTGTVVLVEPDSLAMLDNAACAGESERRISMIKSAVDILTAAKLTIYLDAGNSHWVQPDVMAGLLEKVGIAKARGFFTNVSNYYPVDQERAYAETLSKLVGDKHYVIDVSRNGNGWRGAWCNAPGAALGQDPHVTAGTTGLDALLWVKHPGLSDGECNGGPAAGKWWESYALDLVRNRGK
jgi:endoglucanase